MEFDYEKMKDHEYWFPEVFATGNQFTLRFSKGYVVHEVSCFASNGVGCSQWLCGDDYKDVEERRVEIKAEAIRLGLFRIDLGINQGYIRRDMGIFMHACMDTVCKGYELEIINESEQYLK